MTLTAQETIAIFSAEGWEMKGTMDNTVQFSRKKTPGALTSLLLIILVPGIGLVIVILAYLTAKTQTVTIMKSDGQLVAQAGKIRRVITHSGEIESLAKRGKLSSSVKLKPKAKK